MKWDQWLFVLFVGVCAVPLAVAALVVVGMAVEGYGAAREQIDRCQARAETPHDYHRC